MATGYQSKMKVEVLDSITRLHVWSETDQTREPYLVDLEENRGIGKCDCDDFKFHKQPTIAGKIAASDYPVYRCKHIVAGRQFAGEALLESFIRTNRNQTKNLKGKTHES